MRIIQTDDFKRAFKKLPQAIQRLYQIQEDFFLTDWRSPRLHIKKNKTLKHVFSFRITRNYRVLFYFHTTDTAIFFDIDHRKDIYR
ncbi:MAG: hypothetical protein AAB394_02235 [Patescibacteria group bacterium]